MVSKVVKRTIWGTLVGGVVGFVGLAVWDWHRAGYGTLPELGSGEYAISFKSGFRGITKDYVPPETPRPIDWRLQDADPTRRFLGVPVNIESWFEDSWSVCIKPTEEHKSRIPRELSEEMQNARLDAVCFVEADGKEIPRGLIYSIPKS